MARVLQNVQLDVETAQLARLFSGGSIEFRLLKGPSIAEWLYLPGERTYGDIDLLIAPRQLKSAGQVLRHRGYERRVDLEPTQLDRSDRATYAFSWRHPDGFLVEIHQTLVGASARPSEVWRVLSDHVDELLVAGYPLPVLSVAARAFHLALHAAQHGPDVDKPLEDLRRGLTNEQLDVWTQASKLAIGLDALDAFTHGLALVPEGRRMLDSLGLHPSLSLDVVLHASHSRSSARSIEWFLHLSLRDKVRWVARKVAPTPGFMRTWHPLARRGPLGLAAAYAWRPLWLSGELIAGLVERRRVRKRMEQDEMRES